MIAVLPAPLALAAALALTASAGSAPSTRAVDLHGTYRVHGQARIAASPVLDRDQEVYADAVLRPGRSAREVSLVLAAKGQRCALSARLGDGGTLAFDAGQQCALALDGSGARGQVSARLRSGRGRVDGGRLALDLAWDISGRVAVRTGGGRYEVLGNTVDVPATWAPEVPVTGQASAAVEGRRDESRAGGR